MSLITSYRDTRQHSEEICAPLAAEDYVPQLVDYASPPKWHLAHTTWFFEEMILRKHAHKYREFDPAFSFLFNSYYNSVGDRIARNSRGAITRPDTARVYAYRQHVDAHMLDLMETSVTAEMESLATLGIQHEQQHQELLLTDLKFAFGHNPVYPCYLETATQVEDRNRDSGFISLDEGLYNIGHQGAGFHFDNERQPHKVYLPAFNINKSLVTNAEYLEFMESGAYTDFRHWLDEGWIWARQNNIEAPLYWHRIDGQWHYYTLAGLKPLNPDAMLCHVSYYEASAYASWKGMRLPTEFEWEAASDHFAWGKRWEWTASAYLPYPGFRISEGAVGEYNGKFMINQMVLRGASVATSKGHSRKTYRNFFHPHLQWQFSGIRLAQ